MSDIVVKKLKKYVLYISTIFFAFLGLHLLYTYLYDGSISKAQAGGTVSEALIGNFPHLNPLVPSNDHNAYINGLLYRSMLEYSTVSGAFESDIMSCNLDNLLYIKCVLENNLLWSDGTPISPEDIKATLNIISQTKVNPIIASLLEGTTIETSDDSISFTNETKDINFLHIFLQSILPKSLIETLDTENIDGKFSEATGIYSGRFVLTNISQDETVGITKITLGKNEQYFENNMYINFLILNLFRDEAHFLKNKNSFNLFNDKNAIIGGSIPRLSVSSYSLSQFVGSFFNTEKLDSPLRDYLSYSMDRDTIIQSIGESQVSPAYNPLLVDTNIDAPENNFDLSVFLEKQGYYSKKELLKSALNIRKSLREENTSPEAIPVEIIETKPTQEDLKIIYSPGVQKYNFSSEDNILLSGNVEEGVDAVYINEYKLSGYTSGESIFHYRLLESYDSIISGENNYKIYFEKNGKKELQEEFFYIYNTDTTVLETIRNNFFEKEVEQKLSNLETTLEEELALKEIDQETASGTEISGIITSLSTNQISDLDANYYYNLDGEIYELILIYPESDRQMSIAVIEIQKQIQKLGISIKLSPLSLGDITIGLRNESLEYDILFMGINLGYFASNIFPYFHSSQVKNGYNFSNFKKLSLDILLEELKSNNLSSTKRSQLEEKMLEILQQENIVKVFYTPKVQFLIDKNIKNFSLPEYLPDEKHRYYPLLQAYLVEKRIIQSGEKGFLGFIKYLFTHIFS